MRIPTAADISELRAVLAPIAKAAGFKRPSVRKGRGTLRGVVVQANAAGSTCVEMMDAMTAAGFVPAPYHGEMDAPRAIATAAGETVGLYLNGLFVRKVEA